MSDWLKLCVESLSDQEGVDFEHIVQDACSEDGTRDWLEKDGRVCSYFERDEGMYDAINRGLRRASGDILGYINCDEQYLPGALAKVKNFFSNNPSVDVLYGDVVMVDRKQSFLSYRKPIAPSSFVTRVHTLSVLTCATFFRRRLIDDLELFFDPTKKTISDKLWNLSVAQSNCKMRLLGDYTSSFTATGNNLAFRDVGLREKAELIGQIPITHRACKPLAILVHRLRKWRAGCYRQEPFEYSVYTPDSPGERRTFQVESPSFRFIEAAQKAH